MTRLLLGTTVLTVIAGCAGTSTSTRPASSTPPRLDVRGIEGAPVRSVEVLVDEPALLVRIVLRAGTPLPEHPSEVPVTIQATRGSGIVTAGGEQIRVDPMHAVVLGAKVPHALVLLVHHLGRADRHGEEAH